MSTYILPAARERAAVPAKTAYLIASGDLRESANTAGWPTQAQMEADVTAALGDLGWTVVRANDVDPATGHGFISSQRMGLEVFKTIPTDAPLIVAEAVWQYSHHVLAGLRTHEGPILTVANFAGDWPGLVGLLDDLVGRLHRRLVQGRARGVDRDGHHHPRRLARAAARRAAGHGRGRARTRSRR
jgi:hypothetical protein